MLVATLLLLGLGFVITFGTIFDVNGYAVSQIKQSKIVADRTSSDAINRKDNLTINAEEIVSEELEKLAFDPKEASLK